MLESSKPKCCILVLVEFENCIYSYFACPGNFSKTPRNTSHRQAITCGSLTQLCLILCNPMDLSSLKKQSMGPIKMKIHHKDLSWWWSGQESACQCRRHRFDPWSGKIPHAGGQPSSWATTTEPAGSRASMLCNKRSHAMRIPSAIMKSSLYSLQRERACMQQLRPRTVINI